jgi:hypothetical protein
MAQSDGIANGKEESTENFNKCSTSSEGAGKSKTEFLTEHHGQVTSTWPYHGVQVQVLAHRLATLTEKMLG